MMFSFTDKDGHTIFVNMECVSQLYITYSESYHEWYAIISGSGGRHQYTISKEMGQKIEAHLKEWTVADL